MDFRNYKNIIPYGFLLFLLISGFISIFDESINNFINSLAIPVFLFSLSIILTKANRSIRQAVYNSIGHTELLMNTAAQEEKSLEFSNRFILLTKKFIHVDAFTITFNVIAMISFCLCLLSLMNIICFPTNCGYINIFSLALVFFDFFILDDIIEKAVKASLEKIRDQAKDKAQKDLSVDGDGK